MERAASLAAEIKRELGIQAALEEGHGGIFEISLKDKIIYSNKGVCSQQYISENIIRDIRVAIKTGDLPKKKPAPKREGG